METSVHPVAGDGIAGGGEARFLFFGVVGFFAYVFDGGGVDRSSVAPPDGLCAGGFAVGAGGELSNHVADGHGFGFDHLNCRPWNGVRPSRSERWWACGVTVTGVVSGSEVPGRAGRE